MTNRKTTDFLKAYEAFKRIMNETPEEAAQRHEAARLEAERDAVRMRMRATGMACRAVGKTMRIRADKKTIVTGVIVEAVPGSTRNRGATIVQQFDIVMECGAAKTRRAFTVEALPRD